MKRTAKIRGARRESTVVKVVPAPARSPWWPYLLAAGAAVIAVFWAYSPALHGPFLFDDTALPFALPGFSDSLRIWLLGVRPTLMFTYWVNSVISHDDPYSYHVVNVLFHCISAGLVFFIVRRILQRAAIGLPRRDFLAGFAAAIFLLHPVQTEAAAYLAGRSDGLSVMLLLGAFAVFLYRPRREISWGVTAVVLVLFGAAVLTKQHTVVLRSEERRVG